MKEVREFIIKNQDKKYLDFSTSIGASSNKKRLGVRVPLLRNYAKTLSKKYSLDYLITNIGEDFYEEVMLKGFIIGNYNLSFSELVKYINYFLPKISDWAICDTFVSGLKISQKYSNELWEYLNELLNSDDEFTVRFSLVMILNYYINDEYKEKIFKLIENVKLDKYYVKMANAWLISYMFINYFDETIQFISKSKLDSFTKGKAITKAIESLKINSDKKEILRKIRSRIKENEEN